MTRVVHVTFLLTTQTIVTGSVYNTEELRSADSWKAALKFISAKATESSGKNSKRAAGPEEGIMRISAPQSNIKALPASKRLNPEASKRNAIQISKALPSSVNDRGKVALTASWGGFCDSRGAQILTFISLDQGWHLITEKEPEAGLTMTQGDSKLIWYLPAGVF